MVFIHHSKIQTFLLYISFLRKCIQIILSDADSSEDDAEKLLGNSQCIAILLQTDTVGWRGHIVKGRVSSFRSLP